MDTSKEWLDAIGRLRLLFGTYEELAAFTGFAASSKNSLSKIGGSNEFIKKAAYDALCRYAEEMIGVNMEEFLVDYSNASAFYEKYSLSGLFRQGKEQKCHILLNVYLDLLDKKDIENFELRRLAGKLSGIDVPLLVLIILHVLPLYKNGRGDVKRMEADIQTTFSFLHRYVMDNSEFVYLPTLEYWENECRDRADTLSRLELYHAFSEVVYSFARVMRPDLLYAHTQSVLGHMLELPDDVLWSQGIEGEYWRMAHLPNGYFLYHYNICHERREIAFERHELILFDNDDEIAAIVLHPKAMLYTLNGKHVTKELIARFSCFMDDTDDPSEIRFEPLSLCHWLKLFTIKKTVLTLDDFPGYTMVNMYPEADYFFRIELEAITEDALFFKREEGGYYRIPKDINEALDWVGFKDNSGILTLTQSGRKFIGFSELNLFYEITTPKDMAKHGIMVVQEIRP